MERSSDRTGESVIPRLEHSSPGEVCHSPWFLPWSSQGKEAAAQLPQPASDGGKTVWGGLRSSLRIVTTYAIPPTFSQARRGNGGKNSLQRSRNRGRRHLSLAEPMARSAAEARLRGDDRHTAALAIGCGMTVHQFNKVARGQAGRGSPRLSGIDVRWRIRPGRGSRHSRGHLSTEQNTRSAAGYCTTRRHCRRALQGLGALYGQTGGAFPGDGAPNAWRWRRPVKAKQGHKCRVANKRRPLAPS